MNDTLWRFAVRNKVKIGLSIVLAIVAPPALHLGLAAWNDRHEQISISLPSGMVEDASHFNQTRMKMVEVSEDLNTAKIQLKNVLKDANARSKKVTIAGSRHTMGGQTIYPDRDTFLRYADREMFGLVMLFHQQRDAASDAKMQDLTQSLIEAALQVGGRYYLPYRLHATPDQFNRAYPQATEFFQLKRQYDPMEVFQNYLYIKYGKSTRSIP